MVRMRFQMVAGSSGMQQMPAATKSGKYRGFQRNMKTTAAQAMPTQLARE